jgi:anti-sigma factor RsiW
METSNVTLTDDEVRERFSAFKDGDLPPEEAAFVKKRLDEDPALKAEYESFRKMMTGLASIALETEGVGKSDPSAPHDGVPKVDLLAGVQKRLHKRSGGKFYRTRWSRTSGVFPLEWIATVILLLLMLLYIGMTYVSGVRPAGGPSASESPAHSGH